MKYTIALFGADTFMETNLAPLLRNEDFTVDLLDVGEIDSVFKCRVPDYNVVIVNTRHASGLKEDTVFTSLLAARGFLLYDEVTPPDGKAPVFLIHPGLSPEELMARINNVLYLNAGQRRSLRVKVNLPVEFEYDGKRSQSMIQDISESGIFISTLAPPPDGTRLTARFSLPNTRAIEAHGRAVYSILCDLDQSIIAHPSSRNKKIVAMPGFGVIFDGMKDDERRAIRDYMKVQR